MALARITEVYSRDAPDPRQVEFAMAVARSAGLEQSQLMETRDAAIRDAARRRARAGLARAMEARDEKALRAAIAFADEALLDSREVAGALAMMEEFESHDASPNARRREVTVSRLKDAIEEKNPEQLTQAIRAAENASLTAKSHRAVLSQARVTLNMVMVRQKRVMHPGRPDDMASAGAHSDLLLQRAA